MRAGVIVTDNAVRHPAYKWAEVLAGQICDLIVIDPKSSSDAARAARRAKTLLEFDLQEALEAHMDGAISHEQSQIASVGSARLNHALVASTSHHSNALQSIMSILDRPDFSMFKDHFSKEEVSAVVSKTVANRMKGAAHLERVVHHNSNPDSPDAEAFRNTHGLAHPRDAQKAPEASTDANTQSEEH